MRVAAAEGIEIEEGAVAMIARSASGSFREALGTLDQLVAFGGNRIGLEEVLELLGAADAELLFGAVDAVAAEDPRGVLIEVEKMARSGRDPAQFARDLLGHLRHLLVTQTVGEVPNTFVVTATDANRLTAQSAAVGAATLVRTIDELSAALTAVREGDDARMAVEIALLKAARPDLDPGAEGLLRRIERLEESIGSGVGAGPRVLSPGDDSLVLAGRRCGRGAIPRATRGSDASDEDDVQPRRAAPDSPTATGAAPRRAWRRGVPPLPTGPAARMRRGCRSRRFSGSGRRCSTICSKSAPALAATFEGARPVGLDDEGLRIGFPATATFNKRKAEAPDKRDQLVEALDSVTGQQAAAALRAARRRAGRARGGSGRGGRGSRGAGREAEERVRRGGGRLMATRWRPGGLRRERPDETGPADAGADAAGAGAAQRRGRRGQRRRRHGQGEDGRRPDPARDHDRPRGRSTPRRPRCSPTWSRRPSTRRCARPRTSPARRWAGSRAGSAAASRGCERRGPGAPRRVWSPSSRGCRGSASAPRSGSPSTSSAPPTRRRRRWPTAIREVKEKVGLCERCFNLAEGPLCRICADTSRDQTMICVVEEPADVIPIERTHEYRGLYHVLGGALSPIDGVDADDLKIAELVRRVEAGGVEEVLIATNPTTTGEATALHIAELLRGSTSGHPAGQRPPGRGRPRARRRGHPGQGPRRPPQSLSTRPRRLDERPWTSVNPLFAARDPCLRPPLPRKFRTWRRRIIQSAGAELRSARLAREVSSHAGAAAGASSSTSSRAATSRPSRPRRGAGRGFRDSCLAPPRSAPSPDVARRASPAGGPSLPPADAPPARPAARDAPALRAPVRDAGDRRRGAGGDATAPGGGRETALAVVAAALRDSIRLVDEPFRIEEDGICVLAPEPGHGRRGADGRAAAAPCSTQLEALGGCQHRDLGRRRRLPRSRRRRRRAAAGGRRGDVAGAGGRAAGRRRPAAAPCKIADRFTKIRP